MIRRCLLVLTMLALVAGSAHFQPLTLSNVRGSCTSTFLKVQSGGSSSSRNFPAAESGALIGDGSGNTAFLNFDFDGFEAIEEPRL